MRTHRALLATTACLAAVVALGFAVTNANARRLQISALGFRIVWTPVRFSSGEASVSCNATLSGSFNSSSIAKITNLRIGNVTRASLSSCTGGSATLLGETLPWPISFEAFIGRLPEIVGVTILFRGHRITISPTGFPRCLANTEEPSALGTMNLETGGTVTGLRLDETVEFPLTGEGGLCAFARGHISGTGTVTESEERFPTIRIKLI